MHILGKKAYPRYKLNKENILMVDQRIHQLYDHEGNEKLLREFPEANIVLLMKDNLKAKYNSVKHYNVFK